MRRIMLSALMTVLVFLVSSCSAADPMDTAKKISSDFASSQQVVITADITADYGDRVHEFKLTCTKTSASTGIEIKEPESLAGLTAQCTGDEYELSFDGLQVTTGVLTRNGLSPAEAIPALIDQWQTGYITGAVYENFDGTEAVALDTQLTDTVTQRTWFDTATLLPIHSEISQDGEAVIFCDFENIIME